MKTCMFTGHRPKNLPFGYDERDPRCKELKLRLELAILDRIGEGYTEFLTGMAEGVDTFAAEIVLRLRYTKFPELRLVAVCPCEDQPNRWSEGAKERYASILRMSNDSIVLFPHYTPYCMSARNRYLVDHADACIAVWDGSTGGTSQTVAYAKKKGIPVEIIPI